MFQFFDSSGNKIFIEVKTTCLGKYAAFYLTQNEIATSIKLKSKFFIYRVFDFNKEAKLYTVESSLEDNLDLVATTFRATVKQNDA